MLAASVEDACCHRGNPRAESRPLEQSKTVQPADFAFLDATDLGWGHDRFVEKRRIDTDPEDRAGGVARIRLNVEEEPQPAGRKIEDVPIRSPKEPATLS